MGKRADNARQTRAKLLETADRLIVKNGYEGVSVDSIVKESGIAKGTFYNYFKRKEDLIFALSQQRFAHVTEHSLIPEADAYTNIRDYLVDFMTVIANSRVELTRQWIRYVSASSENEDKWAFDVASLDRLLRVLIANHLLASKTPHERLARTLLTQMYGIILTWCIAPERLDPVQTISDFCDNELTLLIENYQLKR